VTNPLPDTPREHALRLVIWGSANAGMDMITSLVNYAVAARAMRTPSGIAPWRAISLFLGSMTILLSVVAFFVFGTPREVKWLSAREKRIACARVVGGQTGSDGSYNSAFFQNSFFYAPRQGIKDRLADIVSWQRGLDESGSGPRSVLRASIRRHGFSAFWC